MASYFTSTKTGGKTTYPIPDSLKNYDILQILHNHSVLSQILWPHSSATVRTQPSSMSNLSNFIIEQGGSKFKASVCNQPDGVICTEELPLGVKATVIYVIASRNQLADEQDAHSEKAEAVSTSSLVNVSTLPIDHQLYLVEERSATALKPLTSWIKMKQDNPIPKTENLVKVLEQLGEPQKDLVSALSELNRIATHVNTDISLEKAKNE